MELLEEKMSFRNVVFEYGQTGTGIGNGLLGQEAQKRRNFRPSEVL